MSNLDLLLRNSSRGSRTKPTRTDFHIYNFPKGPSNEPQLDAAGYTYYLSKGVNSVETHYQIGGSGAYIEANIRNGVDFVFSHPASYPGYPNDIWYVDTETTYYTGKAADAATDLLGAQNATNWSKSQWATHAGTTMYVGNYGGSTGIRTEGIIGYPFAFTEKTFRDLKNDNDVSGLAVANTWDWMGPELYQTKIDEWVQGLDWLCNEKARMGTTTKLIPFIWRHASSAITTYNLMQAQLEYAYTRPECNGLVLWGTEFAAVGPTYYDGTVWMQAVLDFTTKYGITAGTPF